jgi:transcriptional regulator with XRE-family HTH domain
MVNMKNNKKTIKELRLANFMTQQELADKSGVTRETLNRFENGAKKPYVRSIRNMAAVLGVNPGDILIK